MRTFDRDKAKERIKKSISNLKDAGLNKHVSRVYWTKGTTAGYYRNGPGHSDDIRFNVDKAGRVAFKDAYSDSRPIVPKVKKAGKPRLARKVDTSTSPKAR